MRAIFVAIGLLAAACGGPPSATSVNSTAQPSSTVTSGSPGTTSPMPTYIVGMEAIDVSLNLKDRQFRCGEEREVQASPASAPLVRFHSWRCTSVDEFFLYDVAYVTEDRQRVRLITASITPLVAVPPATARTAAGLFLGFIATMPYANARPTEAQEWVKANVGGPGARTTIATALFEIDPASDKESPPTYRLNIVATGAPTAAAPASPPTSAPQGAPARTTPPSAGPPAVQAAQVAPAVPATVQPVASPARVVIATQTTFCSPGRTTGTVRNDGGTAARLVTVSARIFLGDGRLWTTAEGLTSPAAVPAGGTASFDVAYRNPQICLAGARGDVAVRWDGGTTDSVPLRQ